MNKVVTLLMFKRIFFAILSVTPFLAVPLSAANAGNTDSYASAQWSADMASGTLPIMHINTENSQPIVDKENYVSAGLWIEIPDKCDDKQLGLSSADNPVKLGIRGRGNSSWDNNDKKPYKIKFDSKTELLGLPKHKHFVLLACGNLYTDDWLGQAVGKELANMVGLGWNPRYYPVELVLNGRYDGIYFLYESIKIDSNRLDIFEQPEENTDPTTIPYGWLVEIDNYADEFQVMIPDGETWMRVTHKSPEILSDMQRQWLIDDFTAITETIHGNNRENWTEHIDPASLAKYFIVIEVMVDYDGFNGSVYMHKDMGDSRWKLGPMWDNNSAARSEPSDWTMNILPEWSRWKIIPQIFNTKNFKDAFNKEWKAFYPKLGALKTFILDLAKKCEAAELANQKRWDADYVINENFALRFYEYIERRAKWINDNRENAGIESTEIPDAEVMAHEYITLAGTKVSGRPIPGMYLLRTTYSDGSTTTKKVAIK